MIEIVLEPVLAHTIYKGGRSAEEDFARRHPDATVVKLMQDKRAVEQFTYMEQDAAHQFMDLQDAWLEMPGTPELLVSDVLRPIAQQIDVRRRKPRLAAIPGSSLHGVGGAFDYDTGKLGKDDKGKPYTFYRFHEFLQGRDWLVHPRAFRSSRHAEAWHAQPTSLLGVQFTHKNELFAALREAYQEEVRGREEELVAQVAGLMGTVGLNYDGRVRAIQRMVDIKDDGIVGPVTRGWLALLTIKYVRQATTYKGKGGSDAAPKRKKKASKTRKAGKPDKS
jgi:hypothetical protein